MRRLTDLTRVALRARSGRIAQPGAGSRFSGSGAGRIACPAFRPGPAAALLNAAGTIGIYAHAGVGASFFHTPIT